MKGKQLFGIRRLKLFGALLALTAQLGSAEWINANRYAEAYEQYLEAPSPIPNDGIKHFIFINRDELRGHPLLENPRIAGAQLLYTWRFLEKSPGNYDFAAIHDDLNYLRASGKKLFIQLQTATFDPKWQAVPNYLKADEFDGGQFLKRNERGVETGWMAKRWSPKVRARFALLLEALGREFDGKIEGINLEETAAEGLSRETDPTFTPEGYVEGVKANMYALKQAFPNSVTMQYANFMPGEWLPWEDQGYLRSIYQYGNEIGVGLGAPDLLVRRRAHQNHALALMHENSFSVPLGIAVQRGNYVGMTGADVDPGQIIPKAGPKQASDVPMLHAFAKDFLKVQYIFWQNEEPYLTRDVLTHLR